MFLITVVSLNKTPAEYMLLILSEIFFCTRVQLPLNWLNHSVSSFALHTSASSSLQMQTEEATTMATRRQHLAPKVASLLPFTSRLVCHSRRCRSESKILIKTNLQEIFPNFKTLIFFFAKTFNILASFHDDVGRRTLFRFRVHHPSQSECALNPFYFIKQM